MRIISGKHKGLVIPMPKGGDIRPTTDRAKEALFSILMGRYDFDDLSVLDLFAGTGGMTFEFISRGCAKVTAVEKNRRVLNQAKAFALRHNISDIDYVGADVFTYVKQSKHTFDLIFADPPYHLKTISQLPVLIQNAGLLNPEGLLIIEHESKLKWDHPNLIESRNYGQSVFSMFQFDVPLGK
jgi:16S rRNA (guanine966-N2)-methyltransferase